MQLCYVKFLVDFTDMKLRCQGLCFAHLVYNGLTIDTRFKINFFFTIMQKQFNAKNYEITITICFHRNL